jgi:hypothetical protein
MKGIASVTATSFSDEQRRRIDVSPCPTTKVVARGTLRAIIRQAGLTVDEFKALL